MAEEDRYNYSRETLMARIAVGLGGRVAEELTFGPDGVTTGAENDLQVVTDLARRMVMRWGMSEQIGVVFSDYQAGGSYSLNMRWSEPDTVPAQAHSLAVNAHGNLVLNGTFMPQPQRAVAMSTSAPHNTCSVMMNMLIDTEVQRILNEGRAIARNILTEHCDQLTLLAHTLMEREQLDRTQFEALF
jgi:cell division protease FtsH